MLAKLRTVLSLAPTVEYVDFEDGLLAVRSKKALKFDTSSVKLKTSYGTVIAKVKVESQEREQGVYRLRVLEHQSIPAQLRVERRRHERLSKAVRVTSASFPGFAGMTEDISVSGMKVVTRGPLSPGQEIPVTLELDDERTPPLFMRALVAWSAEKANRNFQSGLKIVGIHPDAERQIRQYIKTRLAIEKRFHTLEEIDPFDTI